MPSAHGALSTEGVLFAVAALVVLAKIGGLVSERLRQPAVLGELVTGILLSTVIGASGVALVRDEHALHVLAEIGVLLLLFDVGLEAGLIAAVLGKLACGAGVVGGGGDRLAVAIGMIPRGEVGLIFAGIGAGLTLNGRPLVDHRYRSIVLVALRRFRTVIVTRLRRSIRRRRRTRPASGAPPPHRAAASGRSRRRARP